ncbi:MAG: zinc ribbon domain-containing protein, partial [Firmicutes bacterium]|nr:zinc ribbon domain-containing protein [Bacillota bacterium]
FCRHCGVEIAPDAEFCHRCGTKVIHVQQAE